MRRKKYVHIIHEKKMYKKKSYYTRDRRGRERNVQLIKCPNISGTQYKI